ncbi:unnamed protein product [Amoebophrya sp. A25]|nr:unnamed protein product [Amoebophrya sp. A25]|eukprot:GSA25T00011377001.1
MPSFSSRSSTPMVESGSVQQGVLLDLGGLFLPNGKHRPRTSDARPKKRSPFVDFRPPTAAATAALQRMQTLIGQPAPQTKTTRVGIEPSVGSQSSSAVGSPAGPPSASLSSPAAISADGGGTVVASQTLFPRSGTSQNLVSSLSRSNSKAASPATDTSNRLLVRPRPDTADAFVGERLKVAAKAADETKKRRPATARAWPGAWAGSRLWPPSFFTPTNSTPVSPVEGPKIVDEHQTDKEQRVRPATVYRTRDGGTLRETSVSGLYLDGHGNYVRKTTGKLDTSENKRRLARKVRQEVFGAGVGNRGLQRLPTHVLPGQHTGLFYDDPDEDEVQFNPDDHGVVAERVRAQQEKRQKLAMYMEKHMQREELASHNKAHQPKKYKNFNSALDDLLQFERKMLSRRMPLTTVEDKKSAQASSSNASTAASTPVEGTNELTSKGYSASVTETQSELASSASSSAAASTVGTPLTQEPAPMQEDGFLARQLLSMLARMSRLVLAEKERTRVQRYLIRSQEVQCLFRLLGNVLPALAALSIPNGFLVPGGITTVAAVASGAETVELFRRSCPIVAAHVENLPVFNRSERVLKTPSQFKALHAKVVKDLRAVQALLQL